MKLLTLAVSEIFKTYYYVTEFGDGSDDMSVIRSRPEIADVVNSGEDAETFREYICVNLWAASLNSFRENRNQPFMKV